MILNKKILEKLLEIMTDKERFSTIPEYDNYLVSDRGYVFSLNTNERMSEEETDKGYLRVALRNKDGISKKRIHRLVAEAFIPNPDGKVQVDHKNALKHDNSVGNLRWLSNQENQIAAVKKGARPTKTNKSAMYRLRKKTAEFEQKRADELAEIKQNKKKTKN